MLRILVVVLVAASTLRSTATEIRWSFDELPADALVADALVGDALVGDALVGDALVGDAALLPIGPSAENLEGESDDLRERYGSEFGQRCLLSRRLIERGVRFVEVAHNLNFVNGTGWDTHNQGQQNQHVLIDQLDRALATMVDDLQAHKLLDRTLIVVATEFGRPATFDGGGGRGHQSTTFRMVLAGGGLKHRGAAARNRKTVTPWAIMVRWFAATWTSSQRF